MSSLTPHIDVCDGLQHFGLARYCDLFRRLEIGRPMCELCNEHRELWEELWQEPQGLGCVSEEDRETLITQMPAVLEFCAHARADKNANVDAAATYFAKPQSEASQLPNARADGRVALWLEKKSPARGKGWQARWFVFCPHAAQVYYFNDEKDESLEGNENKRRLSLALVKRITSNNVESGHFELHSDARTMELRVPSNTAKSLQDVRELISALKELEVFPSENPGTIVSLEDVAREAAKSAEKEAARETAKTSASAAYLAALAMAFDGLQQGDWLEVAKPADVRARTTLSKKVGQLQVGEKLRVQKVKKTDAGGFTKVRFDNGDLKGWVDVVTWDCDILMDMMNERQTVAAWKAFESSIPIPSAGEADPHVGWYRACKKTAIRCAFDVNSPRLDDLPPGSEIEVFESRVNPVDNLRRVRFTIERPGTVKSPPVQLPCWGSVTASDGDTLLEKIPGPLLPLPGERRGAAYVARTVGLWLEKKSPARGKGWQRRWFVLDRCGAVSYYAQQADEQNHHTSRTNGQASGGKLRGEFSLRDCIRISTPKRETGVFELHLQTSTAQIECKIVTLRVEDRYTMNDPPRSYEGDKVSRLEALDRLEELFGVICTNGGLAPGNDGSILNVVADGGTLPEGTLTPATDRQATDDVDRGAPTLPEEAVPPANSQQATRSTLNNTNMLALKVPAGLDEQRATVPLPGARPQGDGAVQLWLEKKSPSVMKGWQRRFFVLHPSGEVFYFSDPSKEKQRSNGRNKETKQSFMLSDCQRFSSENKQQGQFELHFATGKVMQLRVLERNADALIPLQQVLTTMKTNGVLAPENDGLIKEHFDDPVLAALADHQASASVGLDSAPPPPAWSIAAQRAESLGDRNGIVQESNTVPPKLQLAPPQISAPVSAPMTPTASSTSSAPYASASASLASQWQQMQTDDDDSDV